MTDISAADAIAALEAAQSELTEAIRAESSVCGLADYEVAKERVHIAFRAQREAREAAQHAIKRATGKYPYELLAMGL